MEAYADEYDDWNEAEVPCRLITVEVDEKGKVTLEDGTDSKAPCSDFNEAYGDANGASICLDPKDKRPAKYFWPALKKAMAEDIRQDIDIVDSQILDLMRQVNELRLEKAELKKTLARTGKLKLK